MKICEVDLLLNILKSIEGSFEFYSQSKDKADFLNLRGKLETPTLNWFADKKISLYQFWWV